MPKQVGVLARKMKPILFYDDRSPPVRSCLWLIKRLGIDIELKFIDLFKREHLSPEFIKINPAHTVPTLKDGDLVLTDSHPILIHLCDRYGNEKSLYPEDKTLRMKILNKLFFECSVLFRRDSDMMTDIFHKTGADLSQHKQKISEAFSMIETFLSDNKYIACDHLTIADFSIGTTVTTVDLVVPVTEDRWPRLYKWLQQMKSLPYYKEANGVGLDNLREALEKYAEFELPK